MLDEHPPDRVICVPPDGGVPMWIEPSHSAQRARELLRDPERYFAAARERARRDAEVRRYLPVRHNADNRRRIDAREAVPDSRWSANLLASPKLCCN